MVAGGELDPIEIFPAKFWPHHSIVRTPTSPEECAARLAAATCRPIEDNKELAGEFEASGGWLALASGRQLQSKLTLRFEPSGSGTEIRGHTRGDDLQFLLGLFILFVITPFALWMLWLALSTSPPKAFTFAEIMPVAVPVLMIVLGAPHAFKVRNTARRHHQAFMGFVADTVIGAVVQETPASAAHSVRSIVE